MPDLDALRSDLDAHADAPGPGARAAFDRLLDALEAGDVRAADRGEDGVWRANGWVKRGILLGFRLGEIVDLSGDEFAFFDKDTYPIQRFGLEAGVRVVPGGSTVRRGAYLAAWRRVHAADVRQRRRLRGGRHHGRQPRARGQLRPDRRARAPVARRPRSAACSSPSAPRRSSSRTTCSSAAGAAIYEGTVVRERAVLAAGVILTRSTRLYDLVHETVVRSGRGRPARGPGQNAVVVPGLARGRDSRLRRASTG